MAPDLPREDPFLASIEAPAAFFPLSSPLISRCRYARTVHSTLHPSLRFLCAPRFFFLQLDKLFPWGMLFCPVRLRVLLFHKELTSAVASPVRSFFPFRVYLECSVSFPSFPGFIEVPQYCPRFLPLILFVPFFVGGHLMEAHARAYSHARSFF